MDTDLIGRSLLIFGRLTAALGGRFLLASRVPFFGRLPGDISFHRDGLSFIFPLATSIIVSVVLTVILNVAIGLLHK